MYGGVLDLTALSVHRTQPSMMVNLLDHCNDEREFAYYDGQALVVDGLRRFVVEILHFEHFSVEKFGWHRETVLEIGKEGRIIQGPFGSVLLRKKSFIISVP